MGKLILIAMLFTTLMAQGAANAQDSGNIVHELNKAMPGRLLDQNYLTSTGETAARPGLPQSAGQTPLDRRIQKENDRIDKSICVNCVTAGVGAKPATGGNLLANFINKAQGDHLAVLYWCNFTDPYCGEPGHRGGNVQILPTGVPDESGGISSGWSYASVRDDQCERPLFFSEFGREFTFRFKCL
jgi:hypothetical protein